MKIATIQMNMKFGEPEENFAHAKELVKKAAEQGAEVVVLPETWNTGFFPKESLATLADKDGKKTKEVFSGLAKEYGIYIVAGSVATVKNGDVFNTSYTFDKTGKLIGEYDKTHLFTPMNEHGYFKKGDRITTFEIEGRKCGIIICYDIRFPELTRSMTVKGLDMLFVVSQWPAVRTAHLKALVKARAIENQMFVVCCNSCGKAGETVFGGNSTSCDPWGEVIASAGPEEEIIFTDADFSITKNIRETINVFADRRDELYF